MTPNRLTPIYADAPAPPPARKARRSFRIARMELPTIIMLYGVMCGYWLLPDNLRTAGLNPLHWPRGGGHLRSALGQAAQLTIVLLGYDLSLRVGKSRKATR
jgi:hypothetical protein